MQKRQVVVKNYSPLDKSQLAVMVINFSYD